MDSNQARFEDKLEMDWWHGLKDSPGNRLLVKIVRDLCRWAQENFGIGVFHLPYHVKADSDATERLLLMDTMIRPGLSGSAGAVNCHARSAGRFISEVVVYVYSMIADI